MNITPFDIYLWQLADGLSCGIGSLTLFMLLAIIAATVAGWGDDLFFSLEEEKKPAVRKFAKHLSVLMATLILICSLIPSSKTIAMMYVLPKIANSEAIQKDAPEIYKMAIDKLKAELSK